ncbi:DUF3100 domain-containing protein [Paraburkholderia sp.]|uniref:DUF3100 domain-containing protein n=1 Tax=Paraburkholderia sp. TaxID=1926495 RepID=UPI0039E22FBA
MSDSISVARTKEQTRSFGKIFIYGGAILTIAELLGPIRFHFRSGEIVLLPMVWALLLGALAGIISRKSRTAWGLDRSSQTISSAVLQSALLLLVAKLGLLVGGVLPSLAHAGWALAFQEVGHFLGTIIFALPVALLLGIKREAIGATFSVGREPSLAIIGEKYGMDSAEGRGVLAEYITGTILGTIFITLFAGYITSLGIFNPLALAMGAGVGSGSMMAAASSSIAALQSADIAKQVMDFAAASNLITTTIGTYFTLFISLPIACKAYELLEPVLGRLSRSARSQHQADEISSVPRSPEVVQLGPFAKFSTWIVTAVFIIICNLISHHVGYLASLPGIFFILVCVITGNWLYNITGKRLPAVCWVSFIGLALTQPYCPWASEISAWSGKIDFLGVATPMLTFAGLGIAKDLPAFRRLGWKIVLTSLCANAGTFVGATVIAEYLIR